MIPYYELKNRLSKERRRYEFQEKSDYAIGYQAGIDVALILIADIWAMTQKRLKGNNPYFHILCASLKRIVEGKRPGV